jgi:hypothetical protein
MVASAPFASQAIQTSNTLELLWEDVPKRQKECPLNGRGSKPGTSGHLAAAKAEKETMYSTLLISIFGIGLREINDAGEDFSVGENDRAPFRDPARLLLVV